MSSLSILASLWLLGCSVPPPPGQRVPDCSDGASIRRFVGPKPLIQSLWQNLQATRVPLWAKGEFHDQEFKYLGLTQSTKPVQLVLFTTTWGSSCRATNRLLVFDQSNRFLGMYSQLNTVKGFEQGRLLLESGSADFQSGIPGVIDSSGFESAESVKLGY
jgi:hypothetical protein